MVFQRVKEGFFSSLIQCEWFLKVMLQSFGSGQKGQGPTIEKYVTQATDQGTQEKSGSG